MGASGLIRATLFTSNIGNLEKIKNLQDKFPKSWYKDLEIVVQPPADEYDYSLSLWLVMGDDVTVTRDDRTKLISQPDITWGRTVLNYNHIDNQKELDLWSSYFDKAINSLLKNGFSIEHISRFWLFIDGILDDNEGKYQIINLARKKSFEKYKVYQYPASTGIGSRNQIGCVSVLACKKKCGDTFTPFENRVQTNAYQYPENKSEIPPLFARAISLQSRNNQLISISGTASIIGSDSLYENDIERQTLCTIQNISLLINPEHERVHISKIKPGNLKLEGVCSYNVYIKRQEDYKAVQLLCETYFPKEIPAIYTIADVCRGELLVEIEAMAIISS